MSLVTRLNPLGGGKPYSFDKEWKNAGTYFETIKRGGWYEIFQVGGGGRGARQQSSNGMYALAGGGSGSFVHYYLYLTSAEYTIKVAPLCLYPFCTEAELNELSFYRPDLAAEYRNQMAQYNIESYSSFFNPDWGYKISSYSGYAGHCNPHPSDFLNYAPFAGIGGSYKVTENVPQDKYIIISGSTAGNNGDASQIINDYPWVIRSGGSSVYQGENGIWYGNGENSSYGYPEGTVTNGYIRVIYKGQQLD